MRFNIYNNSFSQNSYMVQSILCFEIWKGVSKTLNTVKIQHKVEVSRGGIKSLTVIHPIQASLLKAIPVCRDDLP